MANLSWWKRLSQIERALGMAVCCGCILCTGLIIGIIFIVSEFKFCETVIDEVDIGMENSFDLVDGHDGNVSRSHAMNMNTCNTPTCIHAAADILRNMDRSVQPCDNFYRFVCGNFLRRAPIPDDRNSIDSFILIETQMQEQLAKTFRRLDADENRKHLRLVIDYYKSCMDRRTIASRGVRPLLKMLKDLGGWPVLEGENWNKNSFHWTESVYKFRDLGLSTDYFITVKISVDLLNNTRRVLHLLPPSFGLTREYFEDGTNYQAMQAYRKFMIGVAVLLGASVETAERELAQSFEFEGALAKASEPFKSHRKITITNNPMTVSELSKSYPNIPWKDYLNKLLAPIVSIDDDEVVIANVPLYLSNFERLITNTPPRIQANYVMWRVAAASMTFLTDEFRAKQTEFNKANHGTPKRTSRWRECIRLVSNQLPFSVSSLYIKQYFNDKSMEKVLEILGRVKNTFIRNLMRLDWMDAQTRRNAIIKADSMASRIGYPAELLDDAILDEFYQDLNLNSRRFLENYLNVRRFNTNYEISLLRKPNDKSAWTKHGDVIKVNAQYAATENSIKIPAAILQGRYFNENFPEYLNFGAIGAVIAHEVTHGFDEKGRRYDGHGNLVDWWAESTDQKFSKKVDCIINQYNQYYVPQVKEHVNGLYTQNENIADNGGMKIAYAAYRNWAAKNSEENLLPGLNYTPRQMFWISAANMACSKRRTEFFKYAMIKDKHSPPEFRTIGSFSNMIGFARDFRCNVGTRMNPRHKCVIW